jgi:hypothetical protein
VETPTAPDPSELADDAAVKMGSAKPITRFPISKIVGGALGVGQLDGGPVHRDNAATVGALHSRKRGRTLERARNAGNTG